MNAPPQSATTPSLLDIPGRGVEVNWDPMTPHNSVPSAALPIGFRLDAVSRQVLAERAARLNVSPHDLARDYVMETLQASEERAALREAIRALSAQMQHLREDLALVAENLLVSAGKVTPREARTWVESNFT